MACFRPRTAECKRTIPALSTYIFASVNGPNEAASECNLHFFFCLVSLHNAGSSFTNGNDGLLVVFACTFPHRMLPQI